MVTYKILAGVSSAGLVASGIATSVEPIAGLMGGGVCAVLLGYCLVKVIPHMSEKHAEAHKELAAVQRESAAKFEAGCKYMADCHTASVDKLATQMADGNKEVSSLLRQALFENDTRNMT